MAPPNQSDLIAALQHVEAPDRARLELSLRHHQSDEQVADLTGSTPEEVMWRRAEVINGIARELGRSGPPAVLAIREALTELPPPAWGSRGSIGPPAEAGSGGHPVHPSAAVPAGWKVHPRASVDPLSLARGAALGGTLLLPGVLTMYLSFNAGGFFVAAPAAAVLIVILAMLVRLAIAEHPFEGFGLPLGLTAAALALYGAWTLLSSGWSGAPSRALIEFDRVLLYLLVLVLCGSVLRTRKRVQLMLRGMTLAIVAVCAAGLITRVLPDLWPTEPNTADLGLNYPLTYSNGVGLLAAIGIVLVLHLASDLGEPRPIRVLSAAALPALAATLLLTLSRGAISVCALALLAYAVLGRPRGLVTTLLAAGPGTAVALVVSYRADLLQTPEYASGAALDQGHHVAWVVALCCIISLLLRALLLWVDERLARVELQNRLRRRALAGAAAIAMTTLIAAGFAMGAPAFVGEQYRLFLDRSSIPTSNPRARLASASNNGRIDFWNVALDAWEQNRLKGQGAGTYKLLWARHRPTDTPATDGHSLYVEVLGELGIVGLLLVGGAILLVLGRLASLVRGPDRALYAAVLAAGGAWSVQAGFDWDWELPAVTLPFFAFGGLALATSRPILRAATWPIRLVVGLALILIAITPARIALSEQRLAASNRAFSEGRCDRAIERARASIAALPSRPEAYELVAYCASGGNLGRLSVQTMQRAVDRDPHNWALHYGLAIVRGAARLDPRPAARAALALNPRDAFARKAVRDFSATRDPEVWQQVARRTPLPRF